MEEYVEKEIGGVALDYLRERLSWGKTLSLRVAKLHDLSLGKFTSFLPKDWPTVTIEDLEGGGLNKCWQSETPLVAKIKDYLQLGEDRVVIFEDQNSERTDPINEESPTRMMFFGNEVYHVLLPCDGTEEKISETIDWQRTAWHEIGFFSRLQTTAHPEIRRGQFENSDIELLAAGMSEIVSAAYDGESYIIWKQQRREK